MPFVTPRPLEDDAWRASGEVAHFYGWASDYDGQPKCGTADLPAVCARPTTESDGLCPACDAWYWHNVSMPWLA